MDRRSFLEKIAKGTAVVAVGGLAAACGTDTGDFKNEDRVIYDGNIPFTDESGNITDRRVKYFNGGFFKPDEMVVYKNEKSESQDGENVAFIIKDGHDNNKIGKHRRDKLQVYLENEEEDIAPRTYRKHKFITEDGKEFKGNDDIVDEIKELSQDRLKVAQTLYKNVKKLIKNEFNSMYGVTNKEKNLEALYQQIIKK